MVRDALFAESDRHCWVHGRWHVPAVVGEFNRQTYSALWVGLDGDGTTDLVQAGTESDSVRRQHTIARSGQFWNCRDVRGVGAPGEQSARPGLHSYFGSRNKQISMGGRSGDTLSVVTASDTPSMRFDWKSFS
jgi:hypothetical protein